MRRRERRNESVRDDPVTSEPAGAVAYADGAELGATPLEIVPGNHFRAGFVGLSYRYSGTLSLKKTGCEPWSTEVNDYRRMCTSG